MSGVLKVSAVKVFGFVTSRALLLRSFNVTSTPLPRAAGEAASASTLLLRATLLSDQLQTNPSVTAFNHKIRDLKIGLEQDNATLAGD